MAAAICSASSGNLAEQNEGLRIAEALLQARLEARDRILVPLQQTLDDLQKTKADSIEGLKAMTDFALADGRHIDRLFWLIAIADHIVKQEEPVDVTAISEGEIGHGLEAFDGAAFVF